MGQKDMIEKLLEDYNDVFADIFNVLVFNGDKRVALDSLEESNLKSQYKADDSKLHEQERDVMKYWKNGNMRLAICGIENQTKIDQNMPLRIIGYEGANYRSQYESKNIIPVVTLVLYFGTEHWVQPHNLKGLLSIPEGLEDYVNDYSINVIEVSWLSDAKIAMFESDFKSIANFFVQKRKNPKYEPDDKTEIVHVDAFLKFLSAMTGDQAYKELLANSDFKKEGVSMCSVAQNLLQTGRAEGLAEGREYEILKSVSEGDYSAARGAEKLNISIKELFDKMNAANLPIPENC